MKQIFDLDKSGKKMDGDKVKDFIYLGRITFSCRTVGKYMRYNIYRKPDNNYHIIEHERTRINILGYTNKKDKTKVKYEICKLDLDVFFHMYNVIYSDKENTIFKTWKISSNIVDEDFKKLLNKYICSLQI